MLSTECVNWIILDGLSHHNSGVVEVPAAALNAFLTVHKASWG